MVPTWWSLHVPHMVPDGLYMVPDGPYMVPTWSMMVSTWFLMVSTWFPNGPLMVPDGPHMIPDDPAKINQDGWLDKAFEIKKYVSAMLKYCLNFIQKMQKKIIFLLFFKSGTISAFCFIPVTMLFRAFLCLYMHFEQFCAKLPH